jgi:cation:H+ antiporter
MAVADILGANMLNMAHIFSADLSYRKGPILSQHRYLVSGAHLTTAAVAVAMSLTIIIGLRFRQERKTFVVISWYSPVLIGLYIFGAYALFKGTGL